MASKNPARRSLIVSFVDSYTKEHGFCPTIREISCAVGLKSTATVYDHLKRMQRDGILTFSPFTPRSITLNDSYNGNTRKAIMKNCNALLHCSFLLPDKGRLIGVVAIMENDKGQTLPLIKATKVVEERCEADL